MFLYGLIHEVVDKIKRNISFWRYCG